MEKLIQRLEAEDENLERFKNLDKKPDYNEIIKVNYDKEYHQQVKKGIKILKKKSKK